jgi:hypothetical protein
LQGRLFAVIGPGIKEAQMKKDEGKRKATYAAWHKAVLIGCALIALIGTVGVIGAMIKLSSAISEYGGNIGAPFFVAFLLMLFSVWLFAGSGALLVYIAKMGRDIKGMLQARADL